MSHCYVLTSHSTLKVDQSVNISSSLSLLDYINNPAKGRAFLESQISNAPSQNGLQEELAQFSSPIDTGEIEALIKKMESGESSLSLTTLTNMRDFYAKKIEKEVQTLAARFDITLPVELDVSNNQWSAELPVSASNNETGRFESYLSKDERLSKMLSQYMRLSDTVEVSESREYANQLKGASIDDETIVNYLKSVRDSVSSNTGLRISSEDAYSKVQGEAKSAFKEIIPD